jgi:hypothetical protein
MANSLFDVKKIEQLAKQASEKAIAKATAYLWKVARNSVKKSSGTEKKHDLEIFLGEQQGDSYETVEKAKKYLTSPNRSNDQIIQRGKKDVRSPKAQGRFLNRKASSAGKPPKSHKTITPGWRDHWLREGIRFDPKTGIVYVNPTRKNSSPETARLPALIEEGGQAASNINKLKGYYAYKTYQRNGKTMVSYTPIYHRKEKRYQMKPRPFLKPALIKAADKLLEILENSIGK